VFTGALVGLDGSLAATLARVLQALAGVLVDTELAALAALLATAAAGGGAPTALGELTLAVTAELATDLTHR
jgi:hypothetical protein